MRLRPITTTDLYKRAYTIPEILGLARITRKQADYWAKVGLLKPIMRETKVTVGKPTSFYSASETVKAMVIADLKRCRFSLRQIQQVVRNLEEHGISLETSESYLLTDGYSVYYASNNNEVTDILKHHRQMLLLIPVHEQVQRLKLAA